MQHALNVLDKTMVGPMKHDGYADVHRNARRSMSNATPSKLCTRTHRHTCTWTSRQARGICEPTGAWSLKGHMDGGLIDSNVPWNGSRAGWVSYCHGCQAGVGAHCTGPRPASSATVRSQQSGHQGGCKWQRHWHLEPLNHGGNGAHLQCHPAEQRPKQQQQVLGAIGRQPYVRIFTCQSNKREIGCATRCTTGGV